MVFMRSLTWIFISPFYRFMDDRACCCIICSECVYPENGFLQPFFRALAFVAELLANRISQHLLSLPWRISFLSPLFYYYFGHWAASRWLFAITPNYWEDLEKDFCTEAVPYWALKYYVTLLNGILNALKPPLLDIWSYESLYGMRLSLSLRFLLCSDCYVLIFILCFYCATNRKSTDRDKGTSIYLRIFSLSCFYLRFGLMHPTM